MSLWRRRHRSRLSISFRRIFSSAFILSIATMSIAFFFGYLESTTTYNITRSTILSKTTLKERKVDITYEVFMQSNGTLCSQQSDRRGPHQKVIAVSIYGSTSKYTDNPIFTWSNTILSYIKELSSEVQTQLPEWIIRIYIDFTGSTVSQRASFSSLPNVDVCDVKSVRIPGHESLMTHLPGRMWRFLPIFDRMVDYVVSHDLDSPIIRRQAETIELWLSTLVEDKIFYIARDHMEHGVPILAGLWGAANVRDRHFLYRIFQPMLNPFIARRYRGGGDQSFLADRIWPHIANRSLIFDSYSCAQYGGQPFLSKRPSGYCFLGCQRPCCNVHMQQNNPRFPLEPCPTQCRPKNHQEWIYC